MMRAAVIGVGSIGWNHARIYNELEGVDLVAVADLDGGVAERAAHVYGAKGYTDYREMLGHEELDVVSIAVPTQIHSETALAALQRGCHILVEKPIASTIEEGQEIVALAASRGLKLTVGHIERFNPAIVELKRRLKRGEAGQVFQIHARRLGPFPTRVRDVGVVIDLATHDLDIMRYLLNSEVTRIYAETEQEIHTAHEDLLSGLLRFENGVIGLLSINWLTPTKIRELTVTGERGMFLVNYLTQDLYFYENDHADSQWESLGLLRGVSEGNMVRLKIGKREPLRVEIEAFVKAVLEDEEPAVRGEDGLKALALAQRLVESGRENRVITLAGG
ncbi:MAG: Gfo/Idh/MocA family oxidoreductase [Anaerolineae bacterium]|nr:Gfo/Idh/MocA family oxidoreductase [Anaerolineae bacterium]